MMSPQPPGSFPSAGDTALPFLTENSDGYRQPSRRPSFNFLRRTKSGEGASSMRSTSGNSTTKKQKTLVKEQPLSRGQREAAAMSRKPPKIPDFPPSTYLQTFGGEDGRPDNVTVVSNGASSRPTPKEPMSTTGSNIYHHVPIPPIPSSSTKLNGGYVDPYARTESMAHRGRYSYASSMVSTINSPRRVRRRKDPTPFNILVIGTRNSGKTSFLNFLRKSLTPPSRKQTSNGEEQYDSQSSHVATNPNFTSQFLETEIDNERIGLTLWDSQGLESNIVDLQLRETSSFLESKFEETFNEEMKVIRSPGVRDTHIHCVFLVLDPIRLDANIAAARKVTSPKSPALNGQPAPSSPATRNMGALDENLDLQILRTLRGKTTVVPVISKADTITTAHMAHLKRAVWESLKRENLDTLDAIGVDDGEEDSSLEGDRLDERDEDVAKAKEDRKYVATSHLDFNSDSSSDHSYSNSESIKPSKPWDEIQTSTPDLPFLPLSIISPDLYEPNVTGRKFPWGFANPYDAEHCDFLRLKEAVFTEWRADLREASRELWYEGWRTSRLNKKARKVGGIARAS